MSTAVLVMPQRMRLNSPRVTTTAAQHGSLLERVARGDSGAVREVMEAYGGLVYSLARRFTRNEQEADDAAQDIFLDVWRSAPRYEASLGAEVTFIATIARRRLIDRARKSGRDAARTTLAVEPEHHGAREQNERFERFDEIVKVQKALDVLSPEQQRVLRLSIYHGLSHERIAEATGLPLGTVKTHARRGLIRLRELLGVSKENAEHGSGGGE
ncbi:MAG: sigma-70 family RNA polymerase sigma factor [Phycisphaeraceae bacterium]|nr:sigma-70 family RNA polymerase sigma factor [Phycisphaeraceae bacterium]